MSQDEKRKQDSRLSSLTSALKRRKDERLEIDAYHIGDIRAEKPVVVTDGAMLIGDLLAPEVTVEGLVYGYVACQRLRVGPGGQIWGDVYANSLELASTGKINGWLSTLDAGTVDLLRARELGTGDLPGQGDQNLPAELLTRVLEAGTDVEDDQRESQRRSGIWRQLRSEAALALIARAEIEATFAQRLEEALVGSAVAGQALVSDGIDQELSGENAGDLPDADAGSSASVRPPALDRDSRRSAEIVQLRARLRQATSAAQKYYGELLWTRAELRAARGGDKER